MAEANLARQLKIKIGSLKRLHKEYLSYEKEVEKQSAKIEQMEANNADIYDIKKQVADFYQCLISLERSP